MTRTLLNSGRVGLAGLVCALALGACPRDPDSGKPRIASLDARQWQQRRDKVDTLAEARSPETLAKIVAATRDAHPKVREAAVNALARRQDRSVIPTLARCVKDVDSAVRMAAVKALQQFAGARAVSLVLLRVGAGSSQERKLVLRAVGLQLRRSKPAVRAEAARRLAIMVKAERPQTQQDAAGALVALGPQAVGPVLSVLAAVRPGSEGAWVAVLEKAIGRMGAPAVYPLVKRLRNAANRPVLARAAVGPLVAIGKPAVSLLVRTLDWRKQFPHPAVDLANLALVRLGAVAVDALVGLLKSGLADQRLAAVELLQQIRSPRAAPGLIALLAREKSRTIRLAAVRALGLSRAPQGVAPLLGGLRKERARAKLNSARWAAYREALVTLKTPRKTVLTMLADKSGHVRLVGAQVAGRLRTPGAGAALIGLLKDRQSAVVGAAAQAIGALGVKGASKALRRLAYSRNLTVRRHVLTALGRLGDSKAKGEDVFVSRWGGKERRKRAEIRFRAGVRQGAVKRWHKSGKPEAKGVLHRGRRHGLWRSFWPSGKRRARGRYHTRRRHGAWKQWYAGGTVRASGRYRYGKRRSTWTEYHPNGKRALVFRYKKGRVHGKANSYYPNGKPSSRTTFAAGKRHGAWRTWFASGKSRSTGAYQRGKRHGAWVWFHPSGKQRESGGFDQGKKVGTWTVWNSKGEAVERCDYPSQGPPRCTQ